MSKENLFLILDYILAGLFLLAVIYMYEVRAATIVGPGQVSVQQTQIEPLSLLFARTDGERQLGLGGRMSLSTDQGMLFVFDTPGQYGFWMKDMNFSIDMIWLDVNFNIVHIANDVTPATYPKVFYPGAPSSYVLETDAGYAEKNNLSVGEELDFVKNEMGEVGSAQ